ncbi:unnamed protein product [Rotaria sp. Silwood2]|nr:unnamed protein product [Rotaria sp. Silwood2]
MCVKTRNGTYPHEWNKAAYYRCSKWCAYQQNCPPNYYYYAQINQCQLQPTDWTPRFDLTGRYQLGWGYFMDITQTGYNVRWIYETNEDRYAFVGQYINETMIMGMQTNIKKRTNCIVLENFELSVSGKRNFCRTRATFPCYCIDELPGINDISSGYDAAKMLSANEQNSKYRIFDLSEQNTTPFQTKILGQDRVFTRPKLVQITDISVRKQDTCQTVAYTFESFFRSYFQSTSFGIGIGIPGVISAAVGYSQTLRQVQEAITKSEKAVGVSTTWWGLYSVQLAPPFLLKLDPMFIESVDVLASEASNPSNEDHQAYYNQFVETYGTHYVSRIVVGGTAYLYTLLDSSYHKMSSYEETTSQVSLMFQYQQSYVESQNSESDWEAWQQTAGNYPVVVNRTLFSIHNLIKNKPTVREHLRKTIEFYLQKGVMPTLAELNGRSIGRSSLIPPKPQGPIIGLDVVGCGYDLLLMEITSVEDYFRWTTTVTVRESGGWLGIGRRRSQKTVTEFYRRFYQDYYNLVLRMKQIGWYTLSVTAYPYPKLNPIAQTAFNNLPTNFDIKDLQIWEDFFNIFGTHVVVSSNMGGQVWAETWYEKCLTYEHTQTWINEQVALHDSFDQLSARQLLFFSSIDETVLQYSK